MRRNGCPSLSLLKCERNKKSDEKKPRGKQTVTQQNYIEIQRLLINVARHFLPNVVEINIIAKGLQGTRRELL